MTTDPFGQYHSPYLAMGNNPVITIDPNGGLSWDYFIEAVLNALSVASKFILQNGASISSGFISFTAQSAVNGFVNGIDPPNSSRSNGMGNQRLGNVKFQQTQYKDVTKQFEKTLAETKSFFEQSAKILDNDPNINKSDLKIIKLEIFANLTGNNSPFDIKQIGKGYHWSEIGGKAWYKNRLFDWDGFGNFNFGVAAKAFGFSLNEVLRGAGINQILKGNPDLKNRKGYFDHSQDTDMIMIGYFYFKP